MDRRTAEHEPTPRAIDAGGGDRSALSGPEILYLVALPALAFWLMHFQPIMQNGFLDPYIYTGYINNFDDLFARYGVTYYGVRFGTIVPGQIAAALFGPIPGYFVLRYVLALVASVPFYVFVRQQHGRPIACAAATLLVTSPFLARTLLWEYPDSTGVPFVLAAICLFSIEHRRRGVLDALAGGLAALALNSNVFTLLPLGMYFGTYALLWIVWKRSVGTIPRRFGVMLVAALVVTAAGMAYYWLRVGRGDIFSITYQMATSLLGGKMADWRVAGTDWVTRQWWVLTPVYLAVLALLVWPWRRVAFQDAVVWTSAAAMVTFYYVYQFLLNGTFLQLFYYFSYLLPFLFLLLVLTIAGLWERDASSRRWTLAGTLICAAVGPWVLYSFGRSPLHEASFTGHLVIVAVASLLLVAAARIRRGRPVTSFLATAALGVTLVSAFAGDVGTAYRGTVASRVHPTSTEMDVYGVALQFMKSVPRWAERPGVIRFWYSNEPPSNPMQSVQSTFLWEYSKVQRDGPGLPQLEPGDLEMIREPQVKWLGLLAEKPEQLAAARAALQGTGVQHLALDRRTLTTGRYSLHFELLDLMKDR